MHNVLCIDGWLALDVSSKAEFCDNHSSMNFSRSTCCTSGLKPKANQDTKPVLLLWAILWRALTCLSTISHCSCTVWVPRNPHRSCCGLHLASFPGPIPGLGTRLVFTRSLLLSQAFSVHSTMVVTPISTVLRAATRVTIPYGGCRCGMGVSYRISPYTTNSQS